MKTDLKFGGLVLALCAVLTAVGGGCNKQDVTDTVNQVEQSAEDAADTVAEGVGDVVEEGGKMASALSEKAKAYLSPLKEKFDNLDSLKETPEELKKAVAELIQSIEDKAEDVQLPETVSKALTSVKDRLIALRDYLEGEVEQAQIDEHIESIKDSVKSAFGMSNE